MNRKLRFAVAISVMAAFAGGTTGFYLLGDASLDRQIESFGYEPLKAPSRLWRLGSFYHVLDNGRLNSVCHPDPGRYETLVNISETQSVQASSHFDSTVSIGANFFGSLSALLGGEALKKVSVTLSSVSVHEIDYASLHKIAMDMLSDADCHDVATNLVRDGELVCQVAGALLATADYRVLYDNSLNADVRAKEESVDRLAEALSAEFAGETNGEGMIFITGDSLFYGIFLAPKCLTLPDDKEPRWRDQTWLAKLGRMLSSLA